MSRGGDAFGPSAADLLRLTTVEWPSISPDSHSVAWVRGRELPEQDTRVATLVVQGLGGGAPRELVRDLPAIRSPRWSPDGQLLAYLAPMKSGTELFVVPADGGSARAVTCLGSSIKAFEWSPLGNAFVLVLPCNLGASPAEGTSGDVLRVTRTRWKRDGSGLIGDVFDQLGTVDFEAGGEPANQVAWLVRGRVDVAAPAWSPDGRRIAYIGPPEIEDWEGSRRQGVYVLDLAAHAPTRRLTVFAELRAQDLSWSPDGRWLSVTGHDQEGFGHYGAQRLWLVDGDTGVRRAITTDSDGTIGNAAAYSDTGGTGRCGPAWLPGGGALVCVLSARGRVRLVRIDLDGTIAELTPDDRVIAGFSVAPDGGHAAVVSHPPDGTPDLELVSLTSHGMTRKLSDHGSAVLAGSPAALPQYFLVEDGAGPPLDAWVLLPHLDRGQRVPVILYCGGGPAGMRSNNFHFEWQLFVAAGYAVVWANTRGCQGYGDPFCTAILGTWGEADAQDNMRALDAALELFPGLDPERQAIAGGSYGGFHVVWAISHTNRFCAAVADRSVVDKLAGFGTSDIGALRAFEFGGAPPWEDSGAYIRQSPIDNIGNAVTPTLVVHSAGDERCTVGNGEELYRALRVLGVDTRLVRFPNESHGLSRGGRPWHRVRRLQEYLDWFEQYLTPCYTRGHAPSAGSGPGTAPSR